MALKDQDVQSWHVLIVDDEPDNLGVSKAILEFHGARVHTAKDGKEGLEILSGITPNVILLDLSMPHMDGWQLLKEIRSTPRLADLPVIAVTAHAMQGDRDKALEAGFDDYIPKPFRIATFVQDLKACVAAKPKLVPVSALNALNGKE
jgi:CheY-like chemotaxis protein